MFINSKIITHYKDGKMSKNMAINLAIKAIHKVKPSVQDARMDEEHKREYEKWMEVIHKLEELKD